VPGGGLFGSRAAQAVKKRGSTAGCINKNTIQKTAFFLPRNEEEHLDRYLKFTPYLQNA
jgi:hypothetical protein